MANTENSDKNVLHFLPSSSRRKPRKRLRKGFKHAKSSHLFLEQHGPGLHLFVVSPESLEDLEAAEVGPAGPRQLLVSLRRNHQDAEHLSDAPVQHTSLNFDRWHTYEHMEVYIVSFLRYTLSIYDYGLLSEDFWGEKKLK